MESLNIQPPTRDSFPFVWDLGSRVLKGAVIGGITGLLFFRTSSMRRFSLFYGMGVGLGMSYSQIQHLQSRLINRTSNK